MNAVTNGALIGIALGVMMLAWATIQIPPETIHFLALQQHCKEHAKKDPAVDAYFVCVSRLSR